MLEPQYVYRAKILHIVDGDTVDLFVDLGLRSWTVARVRLLGVNSPERTEAGWAEAKAWTAAWFKAHPEVVVATRMDHTDKYGRWLGTVGLPGDDGDTINQAIVAAGHAVLKDYSASH